MGKTMRGKFLLIWLAIISFVPALSLLPVKFFGP